MASNTLNKDLMAFFTNLQNHGFEPANLRLGLSHISTDHNTDETEDSNSVEDGQLTVSLADVAENVADMSGVLLSCS